MQADDIDDQGRAGSRRSFWLAFRILSTGLWVLVLWILFMVARSESNAASLVSLGAFGALFLVIHVQMLLRYWARRRNHALNAKIMGTAYVSELAELPNRNYLLSELRREIRRARETDTPFTLVIASLESDDARSTQDADFAGRASYQLLAAVRRNFRGSDVLVHLGGASFGVLLVDCSVRGALSYISRLPGHVSVSDGREMFRLPVTIHVAQYDMESFYATDVLSETESAPPLRHKSTGRRASAA